MEKYLIIKSQEEMRELHPYKDWKDIPITLCEDWKKWYKENVDKIDYAFNVWEFKEGKFTCIRKAEDVLEKGVALYYWTKDQAPECEKPHIVYKYPNATRNSKIPKECLSLMERGTDLNDWTEEDGSISFMIGTDYYVYGEYSDNHYTLGF